MRWSSQSGHQIQVRRSVEVVSRVCPPVRRKDEVPSDESSPVRRNELSPGLPLAGLEVLPEDREPDRTRSGALPEYDVDGSSILGPPPGLLPGREPRDRPGGPPFDRVSERPARLRK